MRIFTENVEFISTSDDKNILQIENYEEIFFDVYEISINGNKFVSEKIGEYEKNPIVKIPVEINGIKKNYPFILHEGKFQIVFNEKNELIQEYIEEEASIITEEIEEVEEYSKESFEKELIDIQEKKHKILEYIENVKKTAKQQTDEYNKNQLKILEQQKEQNKKELKSLLESSKESWFCEFVDTSNKIKKELFDRLNINNSEIYESIDLKLEVISDDFKKLINEDFSNTEKIFENKIKELITEIYNNQVVKVINEGIDKISEQSEISFENIKNDFNAVLSEKANDSDLKNVENKLENEILSIQKESIELHDLISKTATSNQKSINFIENKIDQTQIELKESIVKIIDEKIEENEDNITTYYNEKIDIVENKLTNLSDENRQYFIGLISESRDNLLKEIKSIKENNAVEYIIENKKTGEKKEIDINSIKSDLQKEISNKISNEIVSFRKYIAYHSGGGTVAQQFANGGTMNGNLTVQGSISAKTPLGVNGIVVISDKSNVTTATSSPSANTVAARDDGGRLNITRLRLHDPVGPYYSQLNFAPAMSANISFDFPNTGGALATTAFVNNKASDINPLMNGTVAIGTSLQYSREDHVHPVDTSRAPLASPSFTGTPNSTTPDLSSNNTRIATTSFVTNKLGGYVDTSSSQTISGTKTFTGQLVLNFSNNQLVLKNGSAANSILITVPTNLTANRTITIPDVGFSGAFVLNVGPQSLSGVKTFINSPIVPTPTLSNQAAPKGYVDSFIRVLSAQGRISNATTVETDIHSYVLPISTLANNGESVEIELFGSTANNANTKTFKFYFGGTEYINFGSLTLQDVSWTLRIKIQRGDVAGGTGYMKILGVLDYGTGKVIKTIETPNTTIDSTATIATRVTVTATANDDVVSLAGKTVWTQAPKT